ncbi:hypothetical protein VUR80DRAFT_1112 [Thermomyces stellatus]
MRLGRPRREMTLPGGRPAPPLANRDASLWRLFVALERYHPSMRARLVSGTSTLPYYENIREWHYTVAPCDHTLPTGAALTIGGIAGC